MPMQSYRPLEVSYSFNLCLTRYLFLILMIVVTMVQLVVFNDCSTDDSLAIITSWLETFADSDVDVVVLSSLRDTASGPGYGRNQAILHSQGQFICHLGDVSSLNSDSHDTYICLSSFLLAPSHYYTP